MFNEKYADNPFCRVQPKLSPFEVTGAIRLALDRETSADLPASELAQLRSIAEKRIVPDGWQFEIYTVTQHVTDETFLQTSIGLTLIRSDGTASIHEIRRLLNEPADGTEVGRTRVLGLYDVGHMPLWTQDGKKQHAGLLIRYLKTHIDPSSWENGTTLAVHDAAALSLVVHASRKNQNEIARTLESIVPIKMAMEDRRLDMIRYPIGDLPLWSQDGKGQNIPLLGDYLQSVDPRVGWGPADDGHSLAISVTDEEGRKKIADAIDVLRAEMLRDRPAALVKARESHRAAANVSNAQANKADGSGDPRQTQVVAQIPDAAYTRPTADDQRATATIPAEAWGEPVDGLRVAIVLRSPSIDKHQRLCYDIVAENVSDQDIRFGVTLGVDDWHNYCKTKLADADGNPLVQQAGSRLWLPSTLKRLWLKPKERGVISSWATGLLKQDEEEQLPAGLGISGSSQAGIPFRPRWSWDRT